MAEIGQKRFGTIGDRVVMNYHGDSNPPDRFPINGTIGYITGFRTSIYGRTGWGGKRGVYVDRSGFYVKFPNMDAQLAASDFLIPVTGGVYYTYDMDGIKISDVPETQFIEGDIVKTNSPYFKGRDCIITSIDYHDIGKTRNDGVTPMPIYNVMAKDKNSGQMSFQDEDLVLVERGNIWKKDHGEPIIFADLKEETTFYMSIGEYDEIRNPKEDNLYKWTKEQALEAIKDFSGDGLQMSGFFGSEPQPFVIKFHNRDLGYRVRLATLEGFNLA